MTLTLILLVVFTACQVRYVYRVLRPWRVDGPSKYSDLGGVRPRWR